jgi:hypothetical protein
MGNSAITNINLGVPAYIATFVDGDLTAGVLTAIHNLNAQYVSVVVYDNNNIVIIPDDVTATNSTTSTIDLSSYGSLTGTWRVIILDTGATGNTIASDLSLLGQTTNDIAVFNGTSWVAQPPASSGFVGFSAYQTGDTVIATTDVEQDVEFDTEVYDIGSNFNTGTYTFTAPVTGYYQFNVFVAWKFLQTNVGFVRVQIITTARTYGSVQWLNRFGVSGIISRWNQDLSVTADMTATDTAIVRVEYQGSTGSTALDDGSAAAPSSIFMGQLIGI